MRSRLLAAALTALLALGAVACEGETAEGAGTSPANDPGADTGSTGEGFEDLEEPGGDS
jgi:hypothetical protein